MRAQESAEKNSKSVQASKVLGHFAKAEVSYWQDGLCRETYRENGRHSDFPASLFLFSQNLPSCRKKSSD
jgi:hypothetical protein